MRYISEYQKKIMYGYINAYKHYYFEFRHPDDRFMLHYGIYINADKKLEFYTL